MQDAEVWATVMLKGGTRKTTTTVMLALAMARRGRTVGVIDADTGTQGTTEWLTKVYATGARPFPTVQWSRQHGGLLTPFVQDFADREHVDLVLVDLGGEDHNAVEQLLPVVDQVVSPVGPQRAEMLRVGSTISLVYPLKPWWLLTRVNVPYQGAAAEARGSLLAAGERVLTTEVPRNEAYAHAFGTLPDDLGAYTDVSGELVGAAEDPRS